MSHDPGSAIAKFAAAHDLASHVAPSHTARLSILIARAWSGGVRTRANGRQGGKARSTPFDRSCEFCRGRAGHAVVFFWRKRHRPSPLGSRSTLLACEEGGRGGGVFSRRGEESLAALAGGELGTPPRTTWACGHVDPIDPPARHCPTSPSSSSAGHAVAFSYNSSRVEPNGPVENAPLTREPKARPHMSLEPDTATPDLVSTRGRDEPQPEDTP